MEQVIAPCEGRRDGGRSSGKAEAFNRLYEEHMSAIYAYCYARLGNRQDAEDATEQAFVQAWVAFDRYRDQGVPIKAWLYRIASNIVVDLFRRRRIRIYTPLEEADDLVDPSKQPPEAAEARELYSDLQRAIQSLPVDYQQVVALRFSQDMSLAEIAQVMGRSQGSVKMLLHRAVVALRQRLHPDVLERMEVAR
ncbi:MAG: RNA polymerase sigma factor [Chloroflexota bacterium]